MRHSSMMMLAPRSCATDDSESEVSSGIGFRFSSSGSDPDDDDASSELPEVAEKHQSRFHPACSSCQSRLPPFPSEESTKRTRPAPLPKSLNWLVGCSRLRKIQRAERRQRRHQKPHPAIPHTSVQKVSVGIQTSPRDFIEDVEVGHDEEQTSVSNEEDPNAPAFNPLETEMDLSQVSSITSERNAQKPRTSFTFNVNAPPFGALDPHARPFFPQTLRR